MKIVRLFKKVVTLTLIGVLLTTSFSMVYAQGVNPAGARGLADSVERVNQSIAAINDFFENNGVAFYEAGLQEFIIPVNEEHSVTVTVELEVEKLPWATEYDEELRPSEELDFGWEGSFNIFQAMPNRFYTFTVTVSPMDWVLGGSVVYRLNIITGGSFPFTPPLTIEYSSSTVNVIPPIGYGLAGSDAFLFRRFTHFYFNARGFFTLNLLGAFFLPITYNINADVYIPHATHIILDWRISMFGW